MLLRRVNLHPLKSGAILPVERAEVTRAGLAGDRRWMVVRPDGTLLSARRCHDLFRVRAQPVAGGLRLRVGEDCVEVAEPEGPSGPAVPVRLHRHDLLAAESAEGGAWLSRALGRPVRLVWCDDPTRRPLNPAYSRPGDHTAFADGYPVTLASLSSLRRLQDWVAEEALERGEEPAEVPIERFRANLVVDGEEPFAEDGWGAVTVGEVRFRVAKPVDRCVMTTIDPETLATGREPLRTLARHRLFDGVTLFAVQLVPETTGTVSVGDPVVAG